MTFGNKTKQNKNPFIANDVFWNWLIFFCFSRVIELEARCNDVDQMKRNVDSEWRKRRDKNKKVENSVFCDFFWRTEIHQLLTRLWIDRNEKKTKCIEKIETVIAPERRRSLKAASSTTTSRRSTATAPTTTAVTFSGRAALHRWMASRITVTGKRLGRLRCANNDSRASSDFTSPCLWEKGLPEIRFIVLLKLLNYAISQVLLTVS